MSAIARIKEFEEWITSPPYERDISKWSNDETKHAWPGQYQDIVVQLAWEAWKSGYHALEANVLKLTTKNSLAHIATQPR